MARVADVRRLGLGVPAQPAVRNRGPVSRTGKNLTASLPRASTDMLAVVRSNSDQVLRVPENKQQKLHRTGSWRPVSRGGSQPSSASFGPVVVTDEPVTDDAKRAAQRHRERGLCVHLDQKAHQQQAATARQGPREERGQEEDLFAVLQRRIAAQRSELQQHRTDITNAIEQDVQSIQVKWDQDRTELSDVHHRYRQALDELARLRGDLSDIQITLEAAEGGWEETKAEAQELKATLDAELESRKTQVSALEERLETLMEQKDREDSLQQLVEVLREGLNSAKVKGSSAVALQGDVALLKEKCKALSDDKSLVEGEVAKLRMENAAEMRRARGEKEELEQRVKKAEEREEAVRREKEEGAAELQRGREALKEQRNKQEEAVTEAVRNIEKDMQEALHDAEATRSMHAALQQHAADLQAQLARTATALELAAEQLKTAEEDGARAREELQASQERGCELERQRLIAEAEHHRLSEDLAAVQTDAAALREQLGQHDAESALQQDAGGEDESLGVTSERRVKSTTTTTVTTTNGTVTKETKTTTNKLPEGGSVAKGLGVVVNYHSKTTIQALQTTIKEKETIIQQITTQLKATTSELGQAKTFWKSSQNEASKLQSRLRSEQAARSKEQAELQSELEACTARLEAETERFQKSSEEATKLREELRVSEQASEVVKRQRASLEKYLEVVRERAAEAEKGKEVAEQEARARVEGLRAEVERAEKEVEEKERELETICRERKALEVTWDEQRAHASRVAEDMEKRMGEVREEARAARRACDNAKWEMKRKEHEHERAIEQERKKLAEVVEDRVGLELAKRHRQLDAKERHFRSTVGKLLSAEEALESSLTCMGCLSVMKSPVTCSPCGHSFCAGCLPNGPSGPVCLECGPSVRVHTATNSEALDALCGKYEHRMHQLKELQKTLAAPT